MGRGPGGRTVAAVLVILVVVALGGLIAWKIADRVRKAAAEHAYQGRVIGERAVAVAVSEVAEREVSRPIQVTGTVEPETRVTLSAELEEQVVELGPPAGRPAGTKLEKGGRVRKDQVVVRLRSDRREAVLAQAQAAVAMAKASQSGAESVRRRTFDEYRRQQALSKQKLVSEEVLAKFRTGFEVAEARKTETDAELKKAEADLKAAKVELSRAKIATPTDGIVVEKFVEEGDLATRGKPLLVIECLEKVRAVVRVNEDDLAYAVAGKPVSVSFDALGGKTVEVPITAVVPSGDPVTRAYEVRIDIHNAKSFGDDMAVWAKPGMFARVRIPRDKRKLPVVPEEALTIVDGRSYVWTVDAAERARRRRVEVWARPAGLAAISKGLSPGEKVVVTGAQLLDEGSRVKIVGPAGTESPE